MTRRPTRRPTPRPRRLRRLATAGVAAAALLLSGCEFEGAYDLPLPGSPVSEEDGFVVRAGDGSYECDSPFVRGWLIQHTLPDLGLHWDPARLPPG